MCVKCGKEASEGSYKHPYCKKHFKEVWNNDHQKFLEWLGKTHNWIGIRSTEIRKLILFMLILAGSGFFVLILIGVIEEWIKN